jgi:hypothetical protein
MNPKLQGYAYRIYHVAFIRADCHNRLYSRGFESAFLYFYERARVLYTMSRYTSLFLIGGLRDVLIK